MTTTHEYLERVVRDALQTRWADSTVEEDVEAVVVALADDPSIVIACTTAKEEDHGEQATAEAGEH